MIQSTHVQAQGSADSFLSQGARFKVVLRSGEELPARDANDAKRLGHGHRGYTVWMLHVKNTREVVGTYSVKEKPGRSSSGAVRRGRHNVDIATTFSGNLALASWERIY